MTDERFPQPEPDDADEVVLALKTGASLWTSGDKTEAIRWLRKAQESADGSGDDMRSLELARAAADLAEAVQDSAETAPQATEEDKPQLTKPPLPPANPKTRLETPLAKSSNGHSSGNGASEGANGHAAQGALASADPEPVLTQALRVCVKRSVRDDELLVARLLEDGEVPPGYHEALVVLVDPDQDLLDKLS